MSDQHLVKTNLATKQAAAVELDDSLTRKNVLWAANVQLLGQSLDCVITSISANQATIYLSQWAKCRGPVTLINTKLGTISGEAVAQNDKQVFIALHDDAKEVIARILAVI